jgi:hypothetical protein
METSSSEIDYTLPSNIDQFTRGTKTLLGGVPGSGKTTSLPTLLLRPDIEGLFVVGTEPGFEESLLDSAAALGVDMKKLHYRYVSPTVTSFSALRDAARMLNTNSYEDLGKLKHGINKSQYNQFDNLLDVLADLKSERDGTEFGAADQLPKNFALGVDSLTGINKMCYGLHLGGKPAPHQGEWGVIMQFEENFINTLCSALPCFLAMTCHLVKGYNQLTGAPDWTVDALGSKLGPRLPAMFSDAPLQIKEAGQFYWSTNHSNADTKNRALPIAEKLQPTFTQIVDVWKRRCEIAGVKAGE